MAIAVVVLSHSIVAEPANETRRVLILNELDTSYPAITIINQSIQTALNNSPYELEFYSEHMDTISFPDPAAQQEFREFYLRKYRNRRPDVIITIGPTPLKFMRDVHRSAFPGVPIVFCMPNLTLPGAPVLEPDFTGVENDLTPAETVELALRLLPGTKHIVVVTGVSDYDKQQQSEIGRQIGSFTDRVDITYMTDLAMPEMLERLRHLPDHTIVLLATVGKDAAGTRFKSSETGPLVSAASNAPIFSIYDLFLNHGEVGGYLSSISDQGKVAGTMALRILNGEKPRDIPTVKGVSNYMFDWRALNRWGIKESELPPGSVVLNRHPTVWESYKAYIISGVTLILLETLLIFALLWQRAGRRKAEQELAITYDRLRQAVEAGKSVGWDWDVKSGRDRWFGDLQTVFGIQSDTYCGDVSEFRRRIFPEDRELVWKAVADARQNRKPYIAEFRVVRNDGTPRWITAQGQFYYAANGDAERMLGMAVDITERKHAEEALKKSEEKFSKAFRQSPMAVTLTRVKDHRYLEVNETFERLTGWRRDEVIGKNPFDLGIWVDPAKRTELIKRVQTDGAVRDVEFLYRSKNGEQRVALGSVEAIEIDNELCVLSVIADITERREAENAVRETEERFRLVANTAPVLLWMSGPNKGCTYVNQYWLDFSGQTLEHELGNGWTAGIHPEDLKDCLDAYTKAFDLHESFKMQYRMRRHDGEYRWLIDVGVPRFNADGSFVGYIGSCMDVTDRKLAEEALAGIGRRLIEAHEAERTWIARELHDDINQRIALLAVELDRFDQRRSHSEVDGPDQVRHIRQGLFELGKDVQALSHRLHSSKLEYLGIETAANSFCKEFSEQQKVEIDFIHAEIPHGLPKEISLCLFRVLQEALQNAVKHSGMRHFRVELHATAAEIQLTVNDLGVGFDPLDAINRRGLGLISMRERLQLVSGELSIKSQPGEGTTLFARVPLDSNSNSMRAAG